MKSKKYHHKLTKKIFLFLHIFFIERAFQLFDFYRAGHIYVRKLIQKKILQTIQALIISNLRSIQLASKKQTQTSTESMFYSSEGSVDKVFFRETFSAFGMKTKKYRIISQYHNFDLRDSKTEQPSFFLFFANSNIFEFSAFPSNASRKNLTNHTKTVESISLIYSQTFISLEKFFFETFEKNSRRIQLESIKKKPLSKKLNNSRLFILFTLATPSNSPSNQHKKKSNMNRVTQKQIMQMIKAVVVRVMTRTSRNVQKSTEPIESTKSTKLANDGEIVEKGNSKNSDFFDFNYESKSAATTEILIHTDKDIYYKNVHVFVKKMKKMTIVFETKTVRRNLFFCFRGSVLMGHIAKFEDITRRILTYEEKIDEGMKILMTRFKLQTSTATNQLLHQRCIMNDAGRCRKPREYAQKIICLVKSIEMKSIFNQFNMIYNEIDAKLRRNFRRSINISIFDEYFIDLNECKDIGGNLTKNKQNRSRQNQNQINQINQSNQYDKNKAFFYRNRDKYVNYNNYYGRPPNRQTEYQTYNQYVPKKNAEGNQYSFYSLYFFQSMFAQVLITPPQMQNQKAIMFLFKINGKDKINNKNQQNNQHERYQSADTSFQGKIQRDAQRAYFEKIGNKQSAKYSTQYRYTNENEFYENEEYYMQFAPYAFDERKYADQKQFVKKSDDDYEETNNANESQTDFNDYESIHFVNTVKFTFKCKKCSKKFFFNNKFL